MAMNQVQFQKGLSMSEFLRQYGRVEQCHAALLVSRWPEGFVCPHCGETHHSTFIHDGRQNWQYQACCLPDDDYCRYDLPSDEAASDALVSGDALADLSEK